MDSADAEPIKSPSEPNKVSLDVNTGGHAHRAVCIDEDSVCWICLESAGLLSLPCLCPRPAHARCLARWQLQSAGSRRETRCEFCDAELPDWKAVLTPVPAFTAPAIMNVNFDGRTYSFEVRPGHEGYREFTEAIRRAFSLPRDSDLNITFTCDEPTSEDGSLLTLQGPGAYDAAVHCASISAARRQASTGSSSPLSTGSVPSFDGASPGSSTDSGGLTAAPRRRRLAQMSRRFRLAIMDIFQTART